MHKTDVLIIGGGPSGITFARKLKKLCPDKTITMLRPEPYSMVYCAIPYAIEGLFDASKVYKSDSLVTDAGVNLVRRMATEVDLRNRRVKDDAGEEYSADILYIATGASPIRPPIPGADARNIHTIKTQRNMESLLENLGRGAKRAVVVGAGAIGIEQAQAYAARGIETFLIDMATRVLPAMVDQDMANDLHDELREKGIKLLLANQVKQIETSGGMASCVVTSDGQRIDLDPERDFACFAVGMKPDISLFAGQDLVTDRDGIVVDGQMRTNIPGVLSAGDCCSFRSFVDGKPIGGKLATNAVPMAKVAAAAIAGKPASYPGFLNGAATCVGELRVGATGFTADLAERRGLQTITGYGKTTTLFPMMPGAGDLKVKIVAEASNHRIIGAQVVSTLPVTDKIDIITLGIQQRLTLEDMAGLSYSAQPWQSFFPARSAIVDACEDALAQS